MKEIVKTLFVTSLLLWSFGAMAQVEEVDGKFYDASGRLYSGKYEEVYPNGKQKFELHITDGVYDGLCLFYNEAGQCIEQRSFKNGQMDGVWITWNAANVKISEAQYVKGQKDGKWVIWDDAGVLRFELHYAQGKKVGVWRTWDESGKLLSEKKYSE